MFLSYRGLQNDLPVTVSLMHRWKYSGD